MKKTFLLLLLVTFGLSYIYAGDNTPLDLKKIIVPIEPKVICSKTTVQSNNSVSELPVSATISETTLSIYFDMPVGNAVITVYDADNNIVSLEIVDTFTTSEAYLPTDSWASGNYTIKITYGTTTLSGEFLLE